MNAIARRAKASVADWVGAIADGEVAAWRRVARALVVLRVASLAIVRLAHAGIIEDAVKSGLQGMLEYVIDRVNSMRAATLLVACAICTYLVGHAWDLMRALFEDLSGIWAG